MIVLLLAWMDYLPHYAAGLEVKQKHDSKQQLDHSNVDISTLDCHVGIKRKHGIDNIREVATPPSG